MDTRLPLHQPEHPAIWGIQKGHYLLCQQSLPYTLPSLSISRLGWTHQSTSQGITLLLEREGPVTYRRLSVTSAYRKQLSPTVALGSAWTINRITQFEDNRALHSLLTRWEIAWKPNEQFMLTSTWCNPQSLFQSQSTGTALGISICYNANRNVRILADLNAGPNSTPTAGFACAISPADQITLYLGKPGGPSLLALGSAFDIHPCSCQITWTIHPILGSSFTCSLIRYVEKRV